jgi:pimeloyl-ACP methyl ester carboxylesterase
MRRWIVAPVAFVAAALALTAAGGTPAAVAQDKKKTYPDPEVESVTTADGFKLRVLIHKSNDPKAKLNKDQVVILMYPPGGGRDMTKGDWVGLAHRLNDEGYHVFRFDWRGHGASTDIVDTKFFWQTGPTAGLNTSLITGSRKSPLKSELNATKDLSPANLGRYYPVFVNDLAAVRLLIDKRNDAGEVNSSSVYLVGAGEAAALGMLWVTAEWLRPAVSPPPGALGVNVARYAYVPQPLTVGGLGTEAGTTIAGAVWLSPARPVNSPITETAIKNWVSKIAPKMRENNPMLFLYGEKDARGQSQSKFFYSEALVAEGRGSSVEKLDQTFIRAISGTNQSGVNLLGNNTELKTEDRLVEYMSVIQKKRAGVGRVTRGYGESAYSIDLRAFGVSP